MRPWQVSALNVVLMQACWFACVLGAARGWTGAGPAAVAVMVPAHLAFLSRDPRREGALIAGVTVFGFLLETVLSAAGAHRPAPDVFSPPLAPLWMAALWANFAILLDHSLSWLRGRPALAAVLGALGGPAAYLAGVRLGALAVSGNYGTILIGIAWALAMPFLTAVTGRVMKG